MPRSGIPIGRIFGISLKLHYSWFLIFILVTVSLTANFPFVDTSSWTLAMKISAGLVTSFLFFGSVLVHELMHSIVAIKEGIQIQGITLFFLGGVSEMGGEPKRARDEFWMAVAGPFSSLVLGAGFLAVNVYLRGATSVAFQFIDAIAFYLGYINILLGVFNLIPGFPLDGGRVLRSILWLTTKNLQKSTQIASGIGRLVGFGFIFFGIYLVFRPGFTFQGIWIALIGWFLESAAVGSYRQLLLEDVLKGHTASEIMSRDLVVVPADISVERLVNENVLSSGRRSFPVTAGGRVVGFITLHNIRAVPRNLWSTKPVGEAMTPLDKLKSVRPDADLASVLQMLATNDINQAPVISDGTVVGMVGRDHIINFVSTLMEIRGR